MDEDRLRSHMLPRTGGSLRNVRDKRTEKQTWCFDIGPSTKPPFLIIMPFNVFEITSSL